MTDDGGVERFGLLAAMVAGRTIDIAEATTGHPPYTDGQTIYVSKGAGSQEHRREVLVQAALLGAGSLESAVTRSLRGRPALARRYLAIEGHRVLAELADRLPLAARLGSGGPGVDGSASASPARSLEEARGRGTVAAAPPWFGVIEPGSLRVTAARAGGRATDADLRLELRSAGIAPDEGSDDDSAGGPPVTSTILSLFDNPLFNSEAIGSFLRKLLGASGSSGDGTAGGRLRVGAVRRARSAGPHGRPLPTPIHFTGDANPGAAIGVGGALHPEWDVFKGRYRDQWCRVIDYPLTTDAAVADGAVVHDEVLRRRLARIGLGPKVLRRRPDGDELDIEALVDLAVDLRSGCSPPEHIYSEQRKIARNLGVLILLDASGSSVEGDRHGMAVHEHQRRAAATLGVALEELGDRVAVYAFRSHGRHAVHLPAIKTFDQRFGVLSRARLNQLRPAGYTRLGAAIRGGGEILKTEAGTPNRLLLVLSDGHPYDDGYEGRYAEADAHRALEELRADGVACLCLSLGAATSSDALSRVFGSASHAGAAALSDLSPRMDELFLSALRELAAPRAAAARVSAGTR